MTISAIYSKLMIQATTYTHLLNNFIKEVKIIYEKLLSERNKLIMQYQTLKKEIETFPDGELLCVRNGNYIKYFKSNGTNPIYISKKDRQPAETLAIKKYYSLKLKELNQEINLINKYIERYQKIEFRSLTLLDDSSCFKELLKSHFQTPTTEYQQWLDSDYEHNTTHPENLIHKTMSGQKVRSKSEVIIANTLCINKIPYRYECGLHLEDIIFFPDFTILHPKTMELFYWEHFGMMNNNAYSENAYNKLKIYGNHGIIPPINLITTYETQKNPIDSEKINQLVNDYFL